MCKCVPSFLFLLVGLTACTDQGNDKGGTSSSDSTITSARDEPAQSGNAAERAALAADFAPQVHADIADESIEERRPIFSKADTIKLDSALAMAQRITADTLFTQILTRLGSRKGIRWEKSDNLSAIPQQHHADPTRFMLLEYRTRGHYALTDLEPASFKKPSVTASTAPCGSSSNISVKRLDRTMRAIAATMIHERAHTFCHKHYSNNIDDQRNRCDFAYIASDLAVAIDQFRALGSHPIPLPYGPCQKLLDELVATGLAQTEP
jgi:hypothetical protein